MMSRWIQRAGAFLDELAASVSARRESVISAMIRRDRAEIGGYWFQLCVAAGIATLGLVLDSTGVVIGAMLISPLMTPLLNLGMGLAVGSPLLALRSLARTGGSIVAVIAFAAVVSIALPFHEVTREIAARTSPTLLDLLVATFCALAAVYSVLAVKSEVAVTAAGTAIGISLVPPLCVAGLGLGMRQWAVAMGAALLFTANLCAILLVAVAAFVALRFEFAPVEALEEEELARELQPVDRVARRLHVLFRRYPRLLRWSMPMVLLASVVVPLSRALRDVTWQVRVRSQIDALLGETAEAREAVQSAIRVDRAAIVVHLAIVGDPPRAAALERRLGERIRDFSGMAADVQVLALPDARALEAAVAVFRPAEREPPVALDAIRNRIDSALRRAWPASAGGMVAWSVPSALPQIVVVHEGVRVGKPALELVSRALSAAVMVRLDVDEVALGEFDARAAESEAQAFIPRLAVGGTLVAAWPAVRACVEVPGAASRSGARLASARGLVQAELDRIDPARLDVSVGSRWSVRVSAQDCDAQTGAVAQGR